MFFVFEFGLINNKYYNSIIVHKGHDTDINLILIPNAKNFILTAQKLQYFSLCTLF